MKIRLEQKKDYYENENLTREAFWNLYRPGCFEHFVLHNMRNNKNFVKPLSYVLEKNHKLIGSIVYTFATITTPLQQEKSILIFGPLSVLPSEQHKGYGSKLVKYTLAKAEKMGYDLVAITGNPDFYKRFGFESGSKYQIYYEGTNPNEESPFFMVKIFNKENAKQYKGIYHDPACYNVDKTCLDVFEKNFTPKQKLILPGQFES